MRQTGSLRGNRDFMRLWTAATISAFGTDISRTAFPFVAVLVLHASPWNLGNSQYCHNASVVRFRIVRWCLG